MTGLLKKVRHYLGKDLPARVLPLKFDLPKASTRFKASNSSDADLKYMLDEVKGVPAEYLSLLLSEIKHINRCALKPTQRQQLNDDVIDLFYPFALAQFAKYAGTAGVPEDEGRRQALIMLVEIVQILIVSCQILFDGYYRGSDFKYAKAHKAVLQSASRIFELMLLKQRVCALRYQLLGEQDWQLVNTLFYVMNQYEDVEQLLPTLHKELDLKVGQSTACLREQFVSLHVVAKFDLLCWPVKLQWVVESYLRGIGNAVLIRMDDGLTVPGHNELITYCYGHLSARNQPLANPPGPAMILNCVVLMEAMLKDCLGLIQSKKTHNAALMPPRFARFPEEERLVISELLVDGLQEAKSVLSEKRIPINDFRIFIGFVEVSNLLQHQQGQYAGEERLADALTKRSAVMADDGRAIENSLWIMLHQDKNMMRMSTQETPLTTPMYIGALIAYGLGDDIRRPRLAVITRIYRPSEGGLVIDMRRVASYAEAVPMSINASEQIKQTKAGFKFALLINDKRNPGRWDLMFPPMDVLLGIDRVTIYRDQQGLAVSLRSFCNATMDFHLYSTSLDASQLNVVGEPVYRRPEENVAQTGGYFPSF